MHRNHLVPCGVMLVAALLVAVVWGVQLGTLALVAVMLLCPLAMLLVMRSMLIGSQRGDGSPTARSGGSAPDTTR